MIDPSTETLMTLADAAKVPAFRRRGKAPHVASVHRWVNVGARALDGARVQLEVVKLPAGLRTSREAIERFVQRLSADDSHTATPAEIGSAHARAEREMAAAGL